MYKLTEHSIQRISDNVFIPRAESNRDYQQFIQDVAEKGIEIVEGKDVVEPDYVTLRTGEDGYASTGEQLDMQYKGTWETHIADVKTRFPKTNTGSTTIADVDDWVQEKVDAKQFAQQVEAYKIAKTRVAQYQLSVGVPESSETIVTGQEMNMETGEMQDVTETIVTPAIPALEATVEETTYDFDTDTSSTTTVANPVIVKDNEERAAAQAIIDATPGPVKAHVDS